MGSPRLPAESTDLLRSSLKVFLPIAGAISLVLLPMVALYESSRRETVQARVEGLLQAASGQVQITLREMQADTAVMVTLPVVELVSTTSPSPLQRQRVETMMRSNLRELERLRGLVVVDRQGQPLVQAIRGGPLPSPPILREALNRASVLPAGQAWLSPVQWPATGVPELLLARPLFELSGQRAGVLLAVVTMARLTRDFNRITNSEPALESGYLLTREGRTLNASKLGPSGFNFAARYPQVWQVMQRHPSGVVSTDQGLFLYVLGALRPADRHQQGGGLFLYDRSELVQPLSLVIQVPVDSLYRTSVFAQPAGLILLVAVYGLAAASSLSMAYYQRHLRSLGEQDRRLQKRLQAVQDSAGVGMCLCDPASGRFLKVNDALCQFFGRTEEELLHCTWQQLTHPDDLEADQHLIDQLLRGDVDHYRIRKRFLRPDGATNWGDLFMSCTRNDDGTIVDLIAQVSDINELLVKSAYLEAAAQAGVVGVWDWDVVRNVLTWDPVMLELYGLRIETFRGTYEAWSSALHPDDAATVQADMDAALAGQKEYCPRFRILWPDGSVHVIQARSKVTFSDTGEPIRMIGVNYDVTELVQREQELQQQRDLFLGTINSLVDPHLVLDVQWQDEHPFVVSEANPAAARFFRRPEPLLLGLPVEQIVHPDLGQQFVSQLKAVLEKGQPLIADDSPLLSGPENPELSVDLRAVRVGDHVSISFRDISSRKQAVAKLQESEERFRLLAENVTDVVCILQAGRFKWIAPGLSRLLGWSPSHWQGRRLEDLCHPDDVELARTAQADVDRGRRRNDRLRIGDDQNIWHWIELHAGPYRRSDGEQVGSVLSLRLVDREVQAEAELDRRARYDPLTSLLNRNEVFERIEALAHRQRHGDRSMALMFCDIDHFKEINDSHGHAGGDAVLQALAMRLQEQVRAGDLVGRIGGDELLVVLDGVDDLEQALQFAERLHQNVRQPLTLATGVLTPTLSIGVTLVGADELMDGVVARADAAMYQAKKAGRDRVTAIGQPPSAVA